MPRCDVRLAFGVGKNPLRIDVCACRMIRARKKIRSKKKKKGRSLRWLASRASPLCAVSVTALFKKFWLRIVRNKTFSLGFDLAITVYSVEWPGARQEGLWCRNTPNGFLKIWFNYKLLKSNYSDAYIDNSTLTINNNNSTLWLTKKRIRFVFVYDIFENKVYITVKKNTFLYSVTVHVTIIHS